jgi:hypothetical protein
VKPADRLPGNHFSSPETAGGIDTAQRYAMHSAEERAAHVPGGTAAEKAQLRLAPRPRDD